MSTDCSIPPLRDLPTGRLAERKQHLLAEVRRGPRPLLSSFGLHRRRSVAVAVVGAACLAAAAVAASGGWLFSSQGQQIVGVTHVTLHGRSWRITLQQQTPHGGVSTLVTYASSGNITSRRSLGFATLGFVVRPFAAMRVDVPGGQIWAGTTRSTIRSVSITYYSGRAYTVNTTAAPHATKTPYRYWALAVPGVAPAVSLTTHEFNGQSIRWRLTHG